MAKTFPPAFTAVARPSQANLDLAFSGLHSRIPAVSDWSGTDQERVDAALTWIKANGGTLLVDRFYVAKNIRLDGAVYPFRLLGYGWQRSGFVHSDGSGTLVTNSNGSAFVPVTDITLEGLLIDAKYSAYASASASHALSLGFPSRVKVIGCKAKDFKGNGILLWDNTNSGNYTDNWVIDSIADGSHPSSGARVGNNGILIASCPASGIIRSIGKGVLSGSLGPGIAVQLKNVGDTGRMIDCTGINSAVAIGLGNDRYESEALNTAGPIGASVSGCRSIGCDAAFESFSMRDCSIHMALVDMQGIQAYPVSLYGYAYRNTLRIDVLKGLHQSRTAYRVRAHAKDNAMSVGVVGDRHAAGGLVTFDAVDSSALGASMASALGVAISAGGTGYTVDDLLTLAGGTTIEPVKVRVAAVSSGVITMVAIEDSGWYSALPSNPAGVTGGTGSGATFLVTWLGIQATAASVTAGGTGYTVNDTMTVSGGSGTAATVRVTSVSSGVVTGVAITGPGNYATMPTSPAATTGGTGSGCTLTLTAGSPATNNWISFDVLANPLDHPNGSRSLISWAGTRGNGVTLEGRRLVERTTITGGVLTVNNAADHVIELTGEAGVADTIDTILPGIYDGQRVTLRATSETVDITISSGTGNVLLDGDVDFVLTSRRDRLELEWSMPDQQWLEIGRSNNLA